MSSYNAYENNAVEPVGLSMRARLPWITALLATLYITLLMWTNRTGGSAVHLRDLAGSLGIASFTVLIGWTIARRATSDPDRRGLIALIVGMWAPLSASMQMMLQSAVHPVFESTLVATLTWTLACLLLAMLILRTRAELSFATRTLAFATAFLAVTQTARVVGQQRAERQAVAVNAERPAGVPDVYVLLLDKYTSGAWMKNTYGVDQTVMEDSLRAMGFVVPRRASANYAHTHLALASFLNWRYLDVETDGEGGSPWGRTKELIAGARTWSAFREKGYRIFTFPTWYPPTGGLLQSDVRMMWRGARPARLGETWWLNSPFATLRIWPCRPPHCTPRTITPYPIETLGEVEWKLKSFAQLPDSAGPVMAFLHLLMPHEPYLFAEGEGCEPVEPWWPASDVGEENERIGKAYAAQVRCAAPLLLRTVREILANSKTPPVIILQSDHGHGRVFNNLLRGTTLTVQELTRGQIGERFGVFAAYHFPGADTLVTDDISPVNVFPLLATSLWGEPLRMQPNRSFWSAYQESFQFTEVPAVLTIPQALR